MLWGTPCDTVFTCTFYWGKIYSVHKCVNVLTFKINTVQPLTVVGLEQPLQSVAAITAVATGQDIVGQHVGQIPHPAQSTVIEHPFALEQQVGQACLECLLNDVG